jgi:hypothetical protein
VQFSSRLVTGHVCTASIYPASIHPLATHDSMSSDPSLDLSLRARVCTRSHASTNSYNILSHVCLLLSLHSNTPTTEPGVAGVGNTKFELELLSVDNRLRAQYAQAIGSLLYFVSLHPTQTIICLARFTMEPVQWHCLCLRHMLHYLSGTLGYGLSYGSMNCLRCYVDATLPQKQSRL